jgi:hypothetical protein
VRTRAKQIPQKVTTEPNNGHVHPSIHPSIAPSPTLYAPFCADARHKPSDKTSTTAAAVVTRRRDIALTPVLRDLICKKKRRSKSDKQRSKKSHDNATAHRRPRGALQAANDGRPVVPTRFLVQKESFGGKGLEARLAQ